MEQPIVIETREELIYLLSEASQLEHMILCEYLYAAFSLKRGADEGITPEQLEMTKRWERAVSEVAAQEMLHLTLASNLLTAIGASPCFHRPNFPKFAKYFPPGMQFSLLPFGEDALIHFLFLERPEGMERSDAPEYAVLAEANPAAQGSEVVPMVEDFQTVGHLYRGIEQGFRHLVDKYGERQVFVGPPQAQATQDYFNWDELIPVRDLDSAITAIETIVEMGEGARGDWQDSHYGKFLRVYEEYRAAKDADPDFEPARPVVPAVCRLLSDESNLDLIEDPDTARVTDLFNASYELLLQVLVRFFIHEDENPAEFQALADLAVSLMFGPLRTLGRLLTTLPVGPGLPGKTAGPTFEIFGLRSYLLPHRDSAWVLLHERLLELAEDCAEIETEETKRTLDRIAESLRKGAAKLEPYLEPGASA
ncbi:MAG TPA: ferritin-like protein [Nitrolancea sp.]|nr:ferritin-like protein [Nitrolancea sp.]